MRLLLAIFIAFFLISCGNTIYIVRHAEKAKPSAGAPAMEASDPPLSDSGNLRAIALKERMAGENIRYIFSTNYKRTLATAKPLDEYLLNVQTELYDAKKESVPAFIEKIKKIRKGNILIVGHSNTVDDMVNALVGAGVQTDLADSVYDQLFKIKRKGNTYRLMKETYGTPSRLQ